MPRRPTSRRRLDGLRFTEDLALDEATQEVGEVRHPGRDRAKRPGSDDELFPRLCRWTLSDC